MQDFFTTLLQCSLSMSLVTLVYMAMTPILSKRYSPKWLYSVWMLVAVGWIIPFRPYFDLSFLSAQTLNGSLITSQRTPMQMNIGMTSMTSIESRTTISIWQVLIIAWIAGIILIPIYYGLRHRRFTKMISRWSEPKNDLTVLKILNTLKSELKIKAPIALKVCPGITSPMLIGLFQPTVLLPPSSIVEDEIELILKHELIHYQRHDLWYKVLVLIATSLHWYNPIVYLMAKATAVQCEISCDAQVLQGADFQRRKRYGEAIIGVVRNRAKGETALTTHFYGGKKGMKNRISSIMDTKKKKAGVAVLCMVLIGMMMTGAALADTANKGQPTYVDSAGENIKPPKSKAETYAIYEQFGLTFNKNTDQLFYHGKLVRYFEDYYPIGDNESNDYVGIDYFNEDGAIDVHGVRDLSKLIQNPDGSTDPSGRLIGVKPYSQADFDARDIEKIKNPPMQATSGEYASSDHSSAAQELIDDSPNSGSAAMAAEAGSQLTPEELAEMYAIYEPFGVTYDQKKDCFYYDGKQVKLFIDILSSNGESLSSGKFRGTMRQMGKPDGEIEIEAVRDYTKPDTNGYGKLIGIEVMN